MREHLPSQPRTINGRDIAITIALASAATIGVISSLMQNAEWRKGASHASQLAADVWNQPASDMSRDIITDITFGPKVTFDGRGYVFEWRSVERPEMHFDARMRHEKILAFIAEWAAEKGIPYSGEEDLELLLLCGTPEHEDVGVAYRLPVETEYAPETP